MEKILYYDCFAGISGDMNLGALIDLGVPEELLRRELAKLDLTGYRLDVSKGSKLGIAGTKVTVVLEDCERQVNGDQNGEQTHDHAHSHEHDHGHTHDHHSEHVHQHPHEHDQPREGNRRNLGDIESIIQKSTLSETVKQTSLKIFGKLAWAEAKVHGVPVDQVHFHEVGAVDAIVDIVGAAICLDSLGVEKVLSAPVELGGGFVVCEHGTFPVPAPATAEILVGVPVKTGGVKGEATTPTGAAILASVVQEFSDAAGFTVRRIGYGLGHRDAEIPNVLRVILGEMAASDRGKEPGIDRWMLECNIDDMSPELHGHLMERLIKVGADDVWFTPILMKKSRPAVQVSVLCSEAKKDRLTELLLKESSSFGLRLRRTGKLALERTETKFQSSLGEVRIKTAFMDGRPLKWKPEYEDCVAIAEAKGIPLREVYEMIRKEYAP